MDAAQGGRLAAGTLAGVAVSSPLFPRAAVIRRVNGEGALLLGGGRALLMQIAHPRVAQGVADHSDFQRDPFRRLQGTLDAMVTIVFGTEAQAREMAAVVGAVHDRVTGPGYKANDPELLWWVYATLIDTAVRMHARFVRPLTRREADVAVLIRDSTNKEIAERLVLSERTIDNHVQNIMNKLNLHHRAQIASWVTERNTAKGPIVGDVETSLPRRPPRP